MMHVRDDFEVARDSGRTLGSLSTSGAARLGVDRERRIAVDHGALRMQPLLWDGWGRQGIAYGPLAAGSVGVFAVGVLNGHNASQSGHIEQPIEKRLATWLRAGGTQRARSRLLRWARSGQRALTLRKFAGWLLRDPRIHRREPLDDSLAVGLYERPVPTDPRLAELGFVVHSTGGDNGELRARVEGNDLALISGLPNVPLLLVIARTSTHAAYFVSAAEAGLGGRYPAMRPLALTRHRHEGLVYPGVHQGVLGQIGFRVDTRVYGVRVAAAPELATLGVSLGRDVERGRAEWAGAAGLVYLEIELGGAPVRVRCCGSEGGPRGPGGVASTYELELGEGRLRLERGSAGDEAGAREVQWRAPRGTACLQLVALEEELRVIVDGTQRLTLEGAVGALTSIELDAPEEVRRGALSSLRVLPRDVPVPENARIEMPAVPQGRVVRLQDEFSDRPGDLEGRPIGAGPWRKELGAARIVVAPGRGAEVRDARSLTSRGRTVYTCPWAAPGFADLEVRVRPPGAGRGEGQEGRAGIVLWQDPENYVIVGTWLHDHFAGASISSFYCFDGFEDIYDAVWTNVGSAIRWGVPYGLRVLCDGARFTAYVAGRAALHRAFGDVHRRVTSLTLRRVGIVTNWEWGNDTGSVFESFVARS